jgi:hypothetical protein
MDLFDFCNEPKEEPPQLLGVLDGERFIGISLGFHWDLIGIYGFIVILLGFQGDLMGWK